MSELFEWFIGLRPVEWFLDLFRGCPEGAVDCDAMSATELFRWVLLSWLVAAVIFIALDRFGAVLLGRSRPVAQEPPERARTWRWRRKAPPTTYSLLPAGTTITPPARIVLVSTDPVDRPALATPGFPPTTIPDPSLALEDDEFWRIFADQDAPIFGLENLDRLSSGGAPERFNPITGRVESIDRDMDENMLAWPWDATLETVTTSGLRSEEEE